MNFIVNNEENFQTDSSCAVLVQGISSIITDHMPTFHVFRKVHSILASEFSAVYPIDTHVLRMKRHSLK
jgi:hypothetical protein